MSLESESVRLSRQRMAFGILFFAVFVVAFIISAAVFGLRWWPGR